MKGKSIQYRFGIFYNNVWKFVKVTIVEARNLAAKDSSGASDPFVLIKVANKDQ